MKKILVGLSNHHVHLSREAVNILFGDNYELTVKRKLRQLNQYACEECVDVYIDGVLIPHLRVIGPCRDYTQVELLKGDFDRLDRKVVYSDSGKLEETLAFKLVGPCGEYECDKGAFVANNHIHFSSDDLKEFNISSEQGISVITKDGKIINDINVKSDDTCVLEFHLNKDEGETLGIMNNDEVEIC